MVVVVVEEGVTGQPSATTGVTEVLAAGVEVPPLLPVGMEIPHQHLQVKETMVAVQIVRLRTTEVVVEVGLVVLAQRVLVRPGGLVAMGYKAHRLLLLTAALALVDRQLQVIIQEVEEGLYFQVVPAGPVVLVVVVQAGLLVLLLPPVKELPTVVVAAGLVLKPQIIHPKTAAPVSSS